MYHERLASLKDLLPFCNQILWRQSGDQFSLVYEPYKSKGILGLRHNSINNPQITGQWSNVCYQERWGTPTPAFSKLFLSWQHHVANLIVQIRGMGTLCPGPHFISFRRNLRKAFFTPTKTTDRKWCRFRNTATALFTSAELAASASPGALKNASAFLKPNWKQPSSFSASSSLELADLRHLYRVCCARCLLYGAKMASFTPEVAWKPWFLRSHRFMKQGPAATSELSCLNLKKDMHGGHDTDNCCRSLDANATVT